MGRWGEQEEVEEEEEEDWGRQSFMEALADVADDRVQVRGEGCGGMCGGMCGGICGDVGAVDMSCILIAMCRDS